LLGYATFASNYNDNPADARVVIMTKTNPGGNIPKYDQGEALTHEVGHWMGVYHTFQVVALIESLW
jgi:hypothetical protein